MNAMKYSSMTSEETAGENTSMRPVMRVRKSSRHM